MTNKKNILFLLLFWVNITTIYSQQEESKCYNWWETDTCPIYMDTIPFIQHIFKIWRYPYPDASFTGKLVILFNIDTCGQITNIEFKGGIADCEPCVKNALEILCSAKPFIPATKNNRSVCSSIILLIPYDHTINLFRSPFHWYLSPKDSSVTDIFNDEH